MESTGATSRDGSQTTIRSPSLLGLTQCLLPSLQTGSPLTWVWKERPVASRVALGVAPAKRPSSARCQRSCQRQSCLLRRLRKRTKRGPSWAWFSTQIQTSSNYSLNFRRKQIPLTASNRRLAAQLTQNAGAQQQTQLKSWDNPPSDRAQIRKYLNNIDSSAYDSKQTTRRNKYSLS